MSDQLDPRLARRRRQVQEASARRRLRWTIGLLSLAISVGVLVAVFQSSWFSIDSITIEGEVRAPVQTLLEEAGVTEGVSIVSIRTGNAENLLRTDPWVAEAEVRVVWPRSVEVDVVEHIPIARIVSNSSWVVTSAQGAVVATAESLVDPLIEIDVGDMRPGDVVTDELVLGALEFVASLPTELKDGLIVRTADNLLVAGVAGHEIELGTPKDMAQKAITLAVLLDEGIADGARVNLVSPLRPAVSNPQPQVESSREETTEVEPSS